MFKPEPQQIALLESMRSTYRLSREAETVRVVGTDTIRVKEGRTICYISDLILGEVYCEGEGTDDASALTDALAKALRAPKPQTPAQKMTANLAAVSAQDATETSVALAAANAEIASLTARLAAAEKPKGGRGRGGNIPGIGLPMENTQD